MGAGALVHGAGTRDLERMGGLLRRLPASGGLLVLAAVALAGLPPLNGFVSEWLLYLGLLDGGAGSGGLSLVAWLALAALALVGALAAIAFTRVLGVALLGEPRSEGAARAHEGGPLLVAPLAALAAANVAIALFPGRAVALVVPAAAQVLGAPEPELRAALAPAVGALAGPMRLGLLALALAAAVAFALSRRLLARRDVSASSTWGCGFSASSPRVQYGAAAYSELAIRALVPVVLRPRASVAPPAGPFPAPSRFSLSSDDPASARVFAPAFARVGEWFARLRRFQQARLNLQLLYTVATVLVLSALLLFHRRWS
jgi:NADH:ubiquinone oxidoreductase subunit 5 (subunit L)/multisubunit Na+/H+ antiporter MnhA subunit